MISDFEITTDLASFPSFCERFFSKYLYQKALKDDTVEDHNVYIHSNGICLVGLAATHPVMSKEIVNINFNIGNIDRSKTAVKGKGKKGGMILQEATTLCKISCFDGSEYGVVSCVQGKLIEVNKRLQENPNLLKQEGDGYIAVILPKSSTTSAFKKEHQLVKERRCMGMAEDS